MLNCINSITNILPDRSKTNQVEELKEKKRERESVEISILCDRERERERERSINSL